MMRAVVSAPPAGGYGTMTRTGRFGQAACARALPIKGVAAIAANTVRRVRAVPDMARSVGFDSNLAPDRGRERPLRLACVLAVFLAAFLAVLHAPAELQVGEEAFRLDPAGIAAIAAPGGEFLLRLIESAAVGIDPRQAFPPLQPLSVGHPP